MSNTLHALLYNTDASSIGADFLGRLSVEIPRKEAKCNETVTRIWSSIVNSEKGLAIEISCEYPRAMVRGRHCNEKSQGMLSFLGQFSSPK